MDADIRGIDGLTLPPFDILKTNSRTDTPFFLTNVINQFFLTNVIKPIHLYSYDLDVYLSICMYLKIAFSTETIFPFITKDFTRFPHHPHKKG